MAEEDNVDSPPEAGEWERVPRRKGCECESGKCTSKAQLRRTHFQNMFAAMEDSDEDEEEMSEDYEPAVDVLDDHLWSFKPTAFIPHGKGIDQAPIALSCADEPGEHHHILINLLPSIPTWFSRFERVIEIIYQDEQFQQSKRDNFLFYKQRGYPLEFHDLSNKFFD